MSFWCIHNEVMPLSYLVFLLWEMNILCPIILVEFYLSSLAGMTHLLSVGHGFLLRPSHVHSRRKGMVVNFYAVSRGL